MGDDDRWRDQHPEPSGDPGHSEAASEHLPRAYASPYGNEEAARMGLDRNTLEGAQLHFFGNLEPGKRSHKVVAWVALILMFGLPLLLSALNVLRGQPSSFRGTSQLSVRAGVISPGVSPRAQDAMRKRSGVEGRAAGGPAG